MDLQAMAQVLQRKGFKPSVFESGEEALQALMQLVPEGAQVGIGGSSTIGDMKIAEALQLRGNPVYWHWLVAPQERPAEHERAAHADFYLSSTNALTEGGTFINIDGTGNRVAGMFFGPKNVVIICGRNKICADEQAAIQRIKSVACPMNARRLGLKTPCSITDTCTDCKSSDRMCNVTTYLEHPTNGRTVYVYLINEDLGF